MKMKKVLALCMSVIMSVLMCACSTSNNGSQKSDGYTIAVLPKLKGENYFDAARGGAEEAAEELGVTLLYDAPPADNATNQKQVDIIEGWVAQGVDAIIVAPIEAETLAPTLKAAMDEGVKIITFDSDSPERNLYANQATAADIAEGLLKASKMDLENKGYGADHPCNIALISVPESMASMYEWELSLLDKIENNADYSWMNVVNPTTDILRIDGSETSTNESAAAIASRMGPDEDQIQLCIGLSTMATAAMGAQYESLAVKPDPNSISLVGLSTPNGVKSYIKDENNPMNYTALWNVSDLGYLALYAAVRACDGTLTESSTSMEAGKLESRDITNQEIILGPLSIWDASNIDDFDF